MKKSDKKTERSGHHSQSADGQLFRWSGALC